MRCEEMILTKHLFFESLEGLNPLRNSIGHLQVKLNSNKIQSIIVMYAVSIRGLKLVYHKQNKISKSGIE